MQRLALLACAASLYGCVDGLECEDGLTEVDGVCAVPDEAVSPASCGPGTHLEDLMCVPDLPPTECDPDSTASIVGDNGVTICFGTGPGRGCDQPITCPTPDASKVTICGEILDLETRDRIADAGGGSASCNPDAPTADGPCSLTIQFYDALAFAGNPQSPPLDVEETVIDECGRFRAHNIPLPFNRSMGVAVDDAEGDARALTGAATFLDSGERLTGFRAYSAARTTDQQWTDDAAPPFAPQTFAEHGVYVGLFLDGDDPVAGVRVTAGGTTRADDDYYFSDPDDDLSTVDPSRDSTGPNGAVLLVNTPLSDHSGSGGERGDCEWEAALGISQIPTVVFVQEKPLLTPLGDPCPPE